MDPSEPRNRTNDLGDGSRAMGTPVTTDAFIASLDEGGPDTPNAALGLPNREGLVVGARR